MQDLPGVDEILRSRGGWSRPSWERTSVTRSGVARSPSMVTAGSPGMRWMKPKTMIEIPARTGT